jgi:hypothetical protein
MHVNRDHPPPIINAGADVGGSQPFLDCGDGGVLVEGGGGAPCHTEVATEVRALGSRSGEASRARAPESPVPKAVLYGAMGVRIGADQGLFFRLTPPSSLRAVIALHRL